MYAIRSYYVPHLHCQQRGEYNPPLPKAESPNLAKVKPPRQPTISHHFISEDDLDKLPVRKQPPELHAVLESLSEGSIEERVAKTTQEGGR